MKIKLSEMKIGELATYEGDVVELRTGGKSGGCKYDTYLAGGIDLRNGKTIERQYPGINVNDLPDLIIDGDEDTLQISGIDF